jgi:hypothetical protein
LSIERNKWKFDLTVLQKGDVLFTRSNFVGTGVAKVTKGQFGHVMLYLENTIIHADTRGVWSKNPQRIIMNNQSRLAVYRLKNSLAVESLQRVEDYARSRVGGIYSIPQAAKSLQKPVRKVTDRYLIDRQFCSRLVAQSFASADVRLVYNIDYCTPNEIAASILLQEVPGAVIPANALDIEFSKTPDFNLEIQAETYKWLNKVRALSEKHQLRPVHAQSDVAQWVLDYPQFDAKICEYIQGTKYLSLCNSDKRKKPWRYNPFLMLEVLVGTQSPEVTLTREHHENQLNLGRIFREYLKAIQNARSGLGYFMLEKQLQKNRLDQMYEWKIAVEYAAKVIGSQLPDD